MILVDNVALCEVIDWLLWRVLAVTLASVKHVPI